MQVRNASDRTPSLAGIGCHRRRRRTWCRGRFDEPGEILDHFGDPLTNAAATLREHTQDAEVTTSGVTRTVELALSCFGHRNVLDMCMPADGDAFDVHEFIKERGTLYLLGRGDTRSPTSALTTAIAEEVLFVAGNKIAPHEPTGRLAPPLLACLDEAPSVAPLPNLPSLLADGRGRGIVTLVALQNFAQLATRWPPAQADAIRNSVVITAVFGGLSVKETENLARQTGVREIDQVQVSTGDRGSSTSYSTREQPVLSAAQIATLPKGQLLVLMASLPPVVTSIPLAYEGRDAPALIAEMELLRIRGGAL